MLVTPKPFILFLALLLHNCPSIVSVLSWLLLLLLDPRQLVGERSLRDACFLPVRRFLICL